MEAQITAPSAPHNPASAVRSCASCALNVRGVCIYVERGNQPDPHGSRGRRITWDLAEHCGQHRFHGEAAWHAARQDENQNQNQTERETER